MVVSRVSLIHILHLVLHHLRISAFWCNLQLNRVFSSAVHSTYVLTRYIVGLYKSSQSE